MALNAEFNENAGREEWFSLEDGMFPSVARPAQAEPVLVRETLPLPFKDSAGFRRREEILKGALLILSQSPTARKFARAAIAAGYAIDVDPPVIGGAGATHEEHAMASADHANRRINLRGGDNPLTLALALAHELAHISQMVNGGLDISITGTHPAAAIRQLLAMEGDARAHEVMVAIELSHPFEGDPQGRLLFPQALDVAADTVGTSFAQAIIARVKPMLQKHHADEGSIAPQKVMAAIFKGFYGSPGLRQRYEDTIVEGLLRQDAASLQDPAHFQGGLSAAELAARIDAHGVAYLGDAPPGYIDLDGPQMMSVSTATQEKLLKLEALRHENPATRDDASWRIPAYAIAPPAKGSKPRQPKP